MRSLIESFEVCGLQYSHFLYPDEDDRIECVDAYENVVLTYTASCAVLEGDREGKVIGRTSMERREGLAATWKFNGDFEVPPRGDLLKLEVEISKRYLEQRLVQQQIELLKLAREKFTNNKYCYICYALTDVQHGRPDLRDAERVIDTYISEVLDSHETCYYSNWLWKEYGSKQWFSSISNLGMDYMRLTWMDYMIHSLETRGVLP